MTTEYPARPSHFAHRYTRLILRSCAAQQISADAVLLCIAVVHTEDAKRYTSPPTFWNDQITVQLGISTSKLVRIRRKAVESGWLVYRPGAKSRAATYYVTIPSEYRDLPDGDISADSIDFPVQKVFQIERESEQEREIPFQIESECEQESEIPFQIEKESGRNPVGIRQTSIPSPSPSPKKKKTKKETTYDPLSAALPFGDEAFAAGWADYVQHRAEIGKPLTKLATTKALTKLKRMGRADAIECMDNSIVGGWTGLFPPRAKADKPAESTSDDRGNPVGEAYLNMTVDELNQVWKP